MFPQALTRCLSLIGWNAQCSISGPWMHCADSYRLWSNAVLEAMQGVQNGNAEGLKVREPFGLHSTLIAESEGRVRWRSARTNPAVLPA